MTREFETIRGGWSNVPKNLKTKTQLSQMGLKPGADPVAEVWSLRQWVYLYEEADAIPKRKPTEKQLAALEKARQKAAAPRTCTQCKEVYPNKKCLSKWNDELICDWCREQREQEEAERLFRKATVHETRVAGPMYNNRQEIIRKMTDKTPLFLEREPSNSHDENAIKVLALVDGEKQQIGYLHRQFAEKFAPMMDNGTEVHVENRGITTEEREVWDGYEWVDGYEMNNYKHVCNLGVDIRIFV